ncbi:dipeptidase [Daejeonella oryzae]|uniref:dipeptidase n=1 Tax=Daejeonella oryzae TaxID=1122943 RepID=UPI00040A346B|nr:dipeptidase [Daejeonella oryzae]
MIFSGIKIKRTAVLLAALFILSIPFSYSQDYKKVHFKNVLIDTHNDILTTALENGYRFDQNLKGRTHSDLNRMKEAGMDVQIFSVWCDGYKQNPFSYANRQIDTLYAWIDRNPEKMMLVKTPSDLKKAVKLQKLGSMIGVEGGHMIENKLSNLDSLFNRGARYLTLTWNNSTEWASSAMEESRAAKSGSGRPSTQLGLSPFGKEIISRMNKLGMMVDLSHVGEKTFWDAIQTSSKPVIVSHSNCYSLCPVFRNLKDEQIIAIGKNGGLINMNFYSGFLSPEYQKLDDEFKVKHKQERDSLLKLNPEPYFANEYLFKKYPLEVQQMRPGLSVIVDHMDHIIKLIGADHVGFGSDFDGVNSTPQGLDDITAYPEIIKEMIKRGYSKKDIRKIMGGNFIRLFKNNMN